MPKLTLSVPHKLGQEEALRRIKGQSDVVRSAYQAQVSDAHDEWEGNTLNFRFDVMGFHVQGSMTVEPAEVNVTTELPMMAMMFKGPIERRAREELEKLLA
jgi:hypothetical protein